MRSSKVDADLLRLIDEVWGGIDGVRVKVLGAREKAEPADAAASSTEIYRVVPGLHRARFLLPEDPIPAAAALRAYNSLRPAGVARRRALAATILKAPAPMGRARLRVDVDHGASDISSVLSRITGVPVVLAIGIGRQGPNRKPVLQAFDHQGKPVAFAKLGSNPHTDRLVSNESRALALMAAEPVAELITPRVVYEGSFKGHPLLVTSPLPTDVKRLRPDETPDALRVARTLARAGEAAPISKSGFARELRDRLKDEGSGPAARAVDALDRLLLDDPVFATGGSHGDWVPWNLARDIGGALVAWDWEHSATSAPVGLDEAHFLLQSSFTGKRRPLAEALRDATANLPHDLPRSTVDLALLELCARALEASRVGAAWNPRFAAQLPEVLGSIPSTD